MYDFVVIGAGLSGGVISRYLAEKGKKVLIIEKRNHMAGNMYDYINEVGIKIQKYGPHVFHTNDEFVYSYIKRFCTPIEYRTKCEAVINGISTPSPFNFKTIDQFYNLEKAEILKNKLLNYYKGSESVTIVELLQSKDEDIREFANFLYENDYKLYTAKQWNISPDKIDPSVLKRVPIWLSYRDTYFSDKYEFIPSEGFDGMYKNIINHCNIDVKLNVDALKFLSFDYENKMVRYKDKICNIVYTGPIDRLFNYKFGELPYRSLKFIFENKNINSYQNVAIVAYPQVEGYTRITEYNKMPIQYSENTCVVYEYPIEYNKQIHAEPYYPILTEASIIMNGLYQKYAEQFHNLFLCGRLADFKYYNMDQVVLRAIEVCKKMEV